MINKCMRMKSFLDSVDTHAHVVKTKYWPIQIQKIRGVSDYRKKIDSKHLHAYWLRGQLR